MKVVSRGGTTVKESLSTSYAPALIAAAHLKGNAYSLDFHSHRQYEVYVFHSGEGKYLINNQIIDLHPGTIICLDGTELHKPHITGEMDQYERSSIHFSPDWVELVLESLDAAFLLKPFTDASHTIFQVQDYSVFTAFDKALRELAKYSFEPFSKEMESELKVHLIQCLFLLHRLDKSTLLEEHIPRTEKALYAEQIASYAQQHFSEKLTIKKMADALNLSESYISHLFKEVTGYTVMSYVMDYRFIQAKSLIEMSSQSKPLKEIALECGFESDAHFNRFFKKKTGLTPRQYRRSSKQI